MNSLNFPILPRTIVKFPGQARNGRGRVLEQTDQALTIEAEPSLIRIALLVLAGLLR